MTCKTILLHLELARSNHHLTAIAGDLAEWLGAGIIGVAGCQPVKIYYDDAVLSGEIMAEDRKEIQKELDLAEKLFRQDLSGKARLQWRASVTCLSLAAYIAQETHGADLVMTGPDIGGTILDSTRRVSIADLVMRAGRPVLIVPRKCKSLPLRHALVAWKNTRECRRAAADALPLLKLCEQVSLTAIVSDANMARGASELGEVKSWLASHGIAAEAACHAAAGDDSAQLNDILHQTGADLLVGGAYGHGRFQEWLLGGVTRDLLLNADRCVLVSH